MAKTHLRSTAAALTLGILTMLSAFDVLGSTVTKLNDDVFAPLRATMLKRKIVIDRLPLYDKTRAVIELEEFQVWAPDGKVIIHGDNGKVLEKLAPPAKRFFRGLVNGDPESFAFFSMDPTGRNIEGLVVTKDKKFAVHSARHSRLPARGRNDSDAMDSFLTEYDELDMLPTSGEGWQCELDKVTMHAPDGRIHATGANGLPVAAEGISGTQTYAIQIEIETDFELYTNAGSNSTNLTNYITNLTGAVSTIYNRDLKTNVTQHNLHIYTTSSDPWAATQADTGLAELGDFYHTTYGGPVGSGVILLSGKNTNSGIAWEGEVCASEFLCSSCGAPFTGHYGGPYAWAGTIGNGGLGTVPDPNATQGGTVDGMPNGGTQAYWPLLEYAHEFGHVMAGHHTHCVALTPTEQMTFGRSFVDLCLGTETNAGCYSGTAGVPVEKGTIMSYCHLFNVGGFPQSRYTFGQAVEASHHELDDYMLNASGPGANGGNVNIVTQTAAFTMSAITAPSTVSAGSTGNMASITASPSLGATYAWQITNGTITSSPTASSVTFTAGASGTITLRASAYGTNGCGISDTKSIVINSLTAPTAVEAHASSNTTILVSWSGTCTPTCHVYRSSDRTTFTLVGSPTLSGFSDTVPDGTITPTAYLYKVRNFNGAVESADSNLDLAENVFFVDNPLVGGSTIVKAVHLTQLRAATDAVRKLANNGVANPGTYTDPTITAGSTLIKALHVTNVRSALDPAMTTLQANVPTLLVGGYTDSSLAGVNIKAVHFQEIRDRLK